MPKKKADRNKIFCAISAAYEGTKTLSGLDLSSGDYSFFAFTWNVSLPHTNFKGAELTGSCFRTELKNCNFEDATMNRSSFICARFGGSSFKNAKLRLSVFYLGDFTNTNFTGADLRGSIFYYTELNGMDFTNANLKLC